RRGAASRDGSRGVPSRARTLQRPARGPDVRGVLSAGDGLTIFNLRVSIELSIDRSKIEDRRLKMGILVISPLQASGARFARAMWRSLTMYRVLVAFLLALSFAAA